MCILSGDVTTINSLDQISIYKTHTVRIVSCLILTVMRFQCDSAIGCFIEENMCLVSLKCGVTGVLWSLVMFNGNS